MADGHLPNLVLVTSGDAGDARNSGLADWASSVAWGRGGFRLGEAGAHGMRPAGSAGFDRPMAFPPEVRRVAQADAVLFLVAAADTSGWEALEALATAVGDQWRGTPVAFVLDGDRPTRQGDPLPGLLRSMGAAVVAPALQLAASWAPLDACGCLRPDAPESTQLRAIVSLLREQVGAARHPVIATTCQAVA